ncbi:lambda family phage tail tape measure protein [Pseudomonas sp. EB276 TE3739]|uniref:phage tail tape measure protein n=1 Tax=Pseudomonas TaxID=286 RepID=UPI00209E8846|nr:phage tail tape measure protein [Pseudomonas koreensis]MCP1474730.1 lambda family phage tail tape measure protein [Pseudomonas koreensis]
MAVTSSAGLTPNLDGLEQAWTQASRITEQKLRQMQKQIEDAAKKIGVTLHASASSIAQANIATYVDVQEQVSKQTHYSDDFDKLRSQGALAAAQVAMGTRESERAKALSEIDQKYALARKALDKPTAGGIAPQDGADYGTKLDELKAEHEQMTLQVQSNYEAMTEAQGNWINGATSAWDDYLTSSNNVAAKSRAVFTSAFNTMGDAVSTFAMTGKFSFSDFAKSVLGDMAKLAAQTAVSSGLNSLFGLVSSAAMSYLGNSAAPTATIAKVDGMSTTFVPQLNTAGITYHAKGGAFTNGVATGPTLAPMAMFGEAGPEAIMPLSRGSDGSLGVQLQGGSLVGSSSHQVVIQQTINVGDGSGGGAVGDMNSQTVAKAYAGAAKQGAAEQIARDLKPGGQIWSAINGR